MSTRQLLIAGGGIGGLAAALAASHAGWEVRVFERASVFQEFGAGVQLGPNVTRILRGWGLESGLRQVAAQPERLQVRNAHSGALLGDMALGASFEQRYGAPYLCIHRADLHMLLTKAVQPRPGVWLRLGTLVDGFQDLGDRVQIRTLNAAKGEIARTRPGMVEGELLIAADGVGSHLRRQLIGDGGPRVPGHLAYRAMVPQESLPTHVAENHVRVWLAPALHVVEYPVSGGRWRNVVAIVEGHIDGDHDRWDHVANAERLSRVLGPVDPLLRDLLIAAQGWRLWVLRDRPPVGSAAEMARGSVGLLGDAAHPMRPYLAQGAGMAIEDAAALGQALGMTELEPALMLKRYALARWQRVARVQARSIRNGRIFHAGGLLRVGRDTSMRWLGERLMDQPWLYGA